MKKKHHHIFHMQSIKNINNPIAFELNQYIEDYNKLEKILSWTKQELSRKHKLINTLNKEKSNKLKQECEELQSSFVAWSRTQWHNKNKIASLKAKLRKAGCFET